MTIRLPRKVDTLEAAIEVDPEKRAAAADNKEGNRVDSKGDDKEDSKEDNKVDARAAENETGDERRGRGQSGRARL